MILHDAFYKALPHEQRLFDYGVRTDGQPVYCGFARLGMATNDTQAWILVFSKYDGSGNLTEQYSLKGAWASRVALFVPYA